MVNNLTAALLCSHILYFNIVHIPFKWSLLTYIYVSFYQIIEKNEIVQETWSTETIVITSRHIQIKFKLLFWSAKSRFYYYNIFWSLRQTVDSHTYKKEIKWGKRKKEKFYMHFFFFFLAQCKKKKKISDFSCFSLLCSDFTTPAVFSVCSTPCWKFILSSPTQSEKITKEILLELNVARIEDCVLSNCKSNKRFPTNDSKQWLFLGLVFEIKKQAENSFTIMALCMFLNMLR